MLFAAAGRRSDLRALTALERAELDAHRRQHESARGQEFVPFRLTIVDGRVLDGPEHAATPAGTLCGLSSEERFVMRHHFRPRAGDACQVCAVEASKERI